MSLPGLDAWLNRGNPSEREFEEMDCHYCHLTISEDDYTTREGGGVTHDAHWWCAMSDRIQDVHDHRGPVLSCVNCQALGATYGDDLCWPCFDAVTAQADDAAIEAIYGAIGR